MTKVRLEMEDEDFHRLIQLLYVTGQYRLKEGNTIRGNALLRYSQLLRDSWVKEELPRLTRNAIRCRKCNDVIESTFRHDFRMCSCGAVGVDGGLDYERRIGEKSQWENMSEWEKDTEE